MTYRTYVRIIASIGPRLLEQSGGPIRSTEELVAETDELHLDICQRQRLLLATLAELDRRRVWERDGNRDIGHWIAGRYGVSATVGARWVAAAHALEVLPRLSGALESGELCLDKIVQLARFVSRDDESKWIAWAKRVTVTTVRHRADVMTRPREDTAAPDDRQRSLTFWYSEDGRLLELYGLLPADQGAAVVKAIDRVADGIARSPADLNPPVHDPDEVTIDQRRADALVLLASQTLVAESDAGRATVVVQAELSALLGDGSGASVDRGGVITSTALRKLTCDPRLQTVVSDGERGVIGIGRASRVVPAWLLRQLRQRDGGCTFPGCGSKRYVHAHHIKHWIEGGATDLDNLVLVCGFHHKLVHEHGWRVSLSPAQIAVWRRPGGHAFEPGLPRGPGVEPARPRLVARVLAAAL